MTCTICKTEYIRRKQIRIARDTRVYRTFPCPNTHLHASLLRKREAVAKLSTSGDTVDETIYSTDFPSRINTVRRRLHMKLYGHTSYIDNAVSDSKRKGDG